MVLDFLLLIELSILELLFTWNIKLARITVCMFVCLSDNFWLNLATCIDKCVNFVLPKEVIWVIYRKYYYFSFYAQTTLDNVFLNISGYAFNLLDKENAVETAKILEIIDYLWNMGILVNIIYFIVLNAHTFIEIW